MSFSSPANLLTLARIPLTLGLLFTAPLSTPFFLLYTLAGITDMLEAPLPGGLIRQAGLVPGWTALRMLFSWVVFCTACCLRCLSPAGLFWH